MASFNDWLKAARERGVPLHLKIDLPSDIERLYSSGLPVLDRLIIRGTEYLWIPSVFSDFCERQDMLWVKVLNIQIGERYSKFGLNPSEARSFIDGLNINMTDFEIQIFKTHPNKFGGNILVEQDRTLIEIIDGPQDIVGKSLRPCFNGCILPTGRLMFYEDDVPEAMRRAAWETLRYLKLSRGEYLQGYFEFIVSDKDKVYFLAYIKDF